jgi:probable phosphoglycerate mutase
MTDNTPRKTVYFVRHGQTLANVSPVFQAESSELSEKGIWQAEKIAQRAAKIPCEVLISSPYHRARQTAEAISKTTGKEVIFSDLFVERKKPKSIQGKPYDDPTARKIWQAWEERLYQSGSQRVEDGENFDDLLERADKALDYLLNRPEQTIMVITHGFFLRTIIARVLLGEDLTGKLRNRIESRSGMENTGLAVLEYRPAFQEPPAWRLWTYNDHTHLIE